MVICGNVTTLDQIWSISKVCRAICWVFYTLTTAPFASVWMTTSPLTSGTESCIPSLWVTNACSIETRYVRILMSFLHVLPSATEPNLIVMETQELTLFACALDVLTTGSVFAKAKKTSEYAAQWKDGVITVVFNEKDDVKSVPDHPARPDNVKIVPPHKAKPRSRTAFVHTLAHAEGHAIDVMWDTVCRFVLQNLPRAFYDDWVRVAGEEAKHFLKWAERLTELGSFYGDHSGHEGFWDAAYETRGSLLARLAVVNLVHEARGLDVHPNAVQRFAKADDKTSLEIIYNNNREETTHVGAGVSWFRYLCKQNGEDPIATFHHIVPQYFKGTLKPPFNKEARAKAGMSEEWYLPLSSDAGCTKKPVD
ncbi:hypothetical protein PsorP6_000929 [Peronosclerospora sorghi]|uniref:Uncharacterized protein n=1 Tax=Peronosclerospora sorghi TaxID=230839 RepID=A0ACC0WQD6_9STRA|nr:hypothetical protein PsorP6_000929 [Peronosclerospora sorghi]